MVEYTYSYSFTNISPAEYRATEFQKTGNLAKTLAVAAPGQRLPLRPGQVLQIDEYRRIGAGASIRAAQRRLENIGGGTQRKYESILRSIDKMSVEADLNSLWYDNLTTATQQYKDYIRDVARFVHLHAGGIIGDHIKDHYFNAGKPHWYPLSIYTIAKKKKLNVPDGARRPYPMVPMWGLTSNKTGLPDSWHQYTYKYGGYTGGGVLGARSPAMMIKLPRTPAGIKTMRGADFITRKDYPKGEYGIPYSGRGAKLYAPEHRAFLMDTVAAIAPKAEYINARGAKHRGFASDGKGRIKVYNLFENFAMVPYIFAHEKGYKTKQGAKVPARPFLVPGFKDGINDVQRLIKLYLNEGTDNVRKAIAISSKKSYRAAFIDAHFGIEYQKFLHRKYGGNLGVKVPDYIVFTSKYDVGKVASKASLAKKMLKGMSGTRLIWWFLPPSKYYHYIGMTFDLYSVATGGFWSLGAVAAMFKAMTVGIIGARMGSPVPFTRKAQRRKFRKGLYTKAGYHRSGSLGTGRRGR
tara:strand:+ start:265 stop:1830 length:1566 start_codon:yes stop_codon:yes gene_type:complete